MSTTTTTTTTTITIINNLFILAGYKVDHSVSGIICHYEILL